MRESVKRAAVAMEQVLARHDNKTHWSQQESAFLFCMLLEHVGQLGAQLMHKNQQSIVHECVDAMSFLHMIADNHGWAGINERDDE